MPRTYNDVVNQGQPGTINGLLFDFDPAIGVVTDVTGLNVASWTDKNGWTATAAMSPQGLSTPSIMPHYDPVGINGSPAIKFDGFDDYMWLPPLVGQALKATTGFTVFNVVNSAVQTASVTNFAISNGLVAGSARMSSGFGAGNTLRIATRRRDNDSIYSDNTAAQQFQNNETFVMCQVGNFTNDGAVSAYTQYKNGAIVYGPQTVATSNAATHAIAANSSPLGGINTGLSSVSVMTTIGGVAANGSYCKYRQGRLLVYNRVLSNYEIAQVTAHLQQKYSVYNIALTAPFNYQMYQMDKTLKTQTVPITGINNGSATTNIQARAISINNPTTTTAWTTIASGITAGATFSGSLTSVPQGQYTIEVRSTLDNNQVARRYQVLVSDIYVLYGQSNATDVVGGDAQSVLLTPKANPAYAPYPTPVAFDSQNAFSEFFDLNHDTSSWPLLGQAYYQAYGTPCGFVFAAIGGLNIDKLSPAGGGYTYPGVVGGDQTGVGQTAYARMLSMVAAATGGTGCKRVLFHQGEANGATDTPTYLTKLNALAANILTDLAVPLMPCKLQICKTYLSAPIDLSTVNTAIGQAWAQAGNNITPGPDFSGIYADADPAATFVVNGFIHILRANKQVQVAQGWTAALIAADSWPAATY